ncbi:hypothetical protein [Siphonobacter sp. SORGH_AS_0500]|uniref:hypothetical protein n=1 Tax=Siphonobacter sp. SORGH_AS_0500 TaxID=1864824 RepID=UPI00350FA8ED
MYFEMDSLGSFLFQAKSYTSIAPGFYRGQIPSEMLRTIKKNYTNWIYFSFAKIM